VDTLDETAIKTAPIIAITPDQKEVEVATVIQTNPPVAAAVTPAPAEAAPVAKTAELPHTASSMPLIALLGGLSISLALGLKFVLKRVS
jgi:LPXTG-motif cell wall-anchored protein